MEKILQMMMYFSWGLWLLFSYVVLFTRKQKPDRGLLLVTFFALVVLGILLKSRLMMIFTAAALLFLVVGMFRKSTRFKKQTPAPLDADTVSKAESPSLFYTFPGMILVSIIILSLFLLLTRDFKSGANYFIESYRYEVEPSKKDIIIGNSREESDITLENTTAESAHLQLQLNEKDFSVRNIGKTRKVDLNGHYLNRVVLKPGDEFEINGREKIRVLQLHRQYTLGRSFKAAITLTGQKEAKVVSLPTLLNKPLLIQYRKSLTSPLAAGLNHLLLPGAQDRAAASITYEPHLSFLGINIYYLIVIFTIVLLSIGIYRYLKNQFNGALLLLFISSLPFMAGFVPPFIQGVIVFLFLPAVIYVQRRRNTTWNWGSVLLVGMFVTLFLLPLLLKMDGDFALEYPDSPEKDSLLVTQDNETFQLKDLRKKLAYEKKHRVILGHTLYQLEVNRIIFFSQVPGPRITLTPLTPEKIDISPDYKAIICDLNMVTPGDNFIYVKYPHSFDPIPATAVSAQKRVFISDAKGNGLVLSKMINENYIAFLKGLVFFILVPFWLFVLLNYINIPKMIKNLFKDRRGTGIDNAADVRNQLHTTGSPGGQPRDTGSLFNRNNMIIYQLVFCMIGLGYVVFGSLALYNNSFFNNFQKYRSQGLPLFVGLFLLSLFLSRYNRWVVFLYRIGKQKKFHVPLLLGILAMLLANHGKAFLYGGILYLAIIFLWRLRKDIYYEYINSYSYAFNIKTLIEKTICSFEEKTNRQIFFGLGRILYNKGWNYLLVSDLLLLLALFFIVLQLFLGGELGVEVGGFLFLPIEIGKILLTIYFADWVSRIDRGMKLNVLWVYTLVSIPFVLLTVFLKDFSPLVVFSFVFLYHIIKIKKNWVYKLLLIAFILTTLVMTVSDLSRYTFPFQYFSIILAVLALLFLIRLWLKKTWPKTVKILLTLGVVSCLAFINYVVIFQPMSAPKTIAGRVSSWLNPWQDYNHSFQYVNSLWLMKGAGALGKSADALAAAGGVPLIEKDLSISLYVSVLGTMGTVLIFFTLLLAAAYVHKLGHTYGEQGRSSPLRWYLYLLEFLVVIFLAQFIVPGLYAVGLLPIMGQPLPFLSYSNNMLLLFALPFSFLMIVIGSNLKEQYLEDIFLLEP